MVWSSQLGARAEHVPEAAALLQDARVHHLWDQGKIVGLAYAPVLGLSEAAWDVWLLYPPGVRWEGEQPPEPAWWEHQLSGRGLSRDRRLDPRRFAARAGELMAGRTDEP